MSTQKRRRLRWSQAVPLDDSWDVVVAGGGPAGCAAAAAAAREGARTLLVEAGGALGGMGTLGLVPAWCPFSDKEKMIYRGLAEKVFTRCKAGMAHVPKDALDWVAIDAERLRRVYDELLAEAGAEVLFQTSLGAVETDGRGGVAAVLVCNKAGLTALRARVFVDATGDADLCAWAGARFWKGDTRGEMMPATHCFVLANVDEHGYRTVPNLHSANPKSPVHAILRSGRHPRIPDSHLCSSLVGPGTVGFNAGHLWNVDGTDPCDLSRALAEGRRIAAAYRDALAEFAPRAFGNAFLVHTGIAMGIRETRRIAGDYVLTVEDYLARRSFPDEICRNAYFIDVHWTKAQAKRVRRDFGSFEKGTLRYGKGESHGIPYRCLTPKGLRNVLVAGRAISCDRRVQGSVRVMPTCLATGEAAGLAAALAAAARRPDVHAVDPDRLRRRLREEGAWLP